MMIEEQKNLKVIKNEQKIKLRQLTSCYLKFLENGLRRNGLENVCNIYLKHHPIKMGIQSGLNIMDHSFTTSSIYHPKVIW
jgi:hypothetical protein